VNVLFATHDLSYADHIAIAYLSAIAKQRGHKTFFCTLTREPFCNNDLLTMVARIKPEVVAYSVNIMGFERAVNLNYQARSIRPFISIMGGPQATFSPETFGDSGMDAYCVGEGEWPFADFLDRVEWRSAFDDISNLITACRYNPVRPLITDLDKLPPADRDLILSNSHLANLSKKTFYTSRGCPFGCAYCCNSYYNLLYKGKGPVVRRFSVGRVLDEMVCVRDKYRMDFVKFGDDCFALRADDWLMEFADAYPKRIGIPFNCYLRLDTVSDDMLQLLKKAGCFSVHLSVDSTSSYVREYILRRKMTTNNIIEKLRLIKSYGINTWVNYMLAVPESTLQDDLDTIEMSRAGKVTYSAYSTTVPMERTELYDYSVKSGFIDLHSYKGDMSGCSQRSELSCFTEKEKDIRYNIYLLGTLATKLPFPLNKSVIFLIKKTSPNIFYKKLRDVVYRFYISNRIFKLTEDD
jgi:radical SAM superfamily enzyme YgiQ (UPF0313 family)